MISRTTRVCCCARAHRIDPHRCRVRAGLSSQAGSNDRAVRAGRADRCGRAPDRTEAVGEPRKTILYREYCRGGRQHRHWPSRKGAGGRLHDPHHGQFPCHESHHLRPGSLRSVQGLRPGDASRRVRIGARGQSLGPGHDCEGPRHADQSRFGQIQFRFAGGRHPITSRGRTVSIVPWSRPRARTLRGRRSGNCLGRGGSYADLLRRTICGRSAGQRRASCASLRS